MSTQPIIDEEPYKVERFTAFPRVGSSNNYLADWMIVTEGYTRKFEHLLSDDVGSHRFWKTCEHYKCEQVPGSGSSAVEVSANYGDLAKYHYAILRDPNALYRNEYGDGGKLNDGLFPFYSQRADGGFVPPPDNLESLLQQSLNAMLPKVKAELSLINSLIELKDIVTLRTTIESVAKLVQNFHRKSARPLGRIFRTKADVYLQYKFNIRPLLSDIHGIYRGIANVERRINDFITRSGCLRVSHFSRQLSESVETIDGATRGSFYASSYPTGDGAYLLPCISVSERLVQPDPTSFHVQVQYNYNYSAYQVEHARWLALLDAFGVNLNPQVIWNAIPWSFVVDWVLGVGQALSDYKVGNMDPKINILQCLWSVKRSRRIVVQGHIDSDLWLEGSSERVRAHYTRPVVRETAYRRQLFNPTSGSIQSSGLSPTEFSLGAALVVSRRRRPTRFRG